jgi:hypothetical protein
VLIQEETMAEKKLIPASEEILPEYEAPQAISLDDVQVRLAAGMCMTGSGDIDYCMTGSAEIG